MRAGEAPTPTPPSHGLLRTGAHPARLPAHLTMGPLAAGSSPGSRANGSFPKGARGFSEKSPAGHPPPHRRDGIAWERGRPAPHPVPLAGAELQCDAAGSHPVDGNRIGQAEGEPWRRSRLIQVGEMAEAVPGLVRAGRPRSRQAFIP